MPHLFIRLSEYVNIVEVDLAGCMGYKTQQRPANSRLATAAFANQAKRRTRSDLETYTVNGFYMPYRTPKKTTADRKPCL